MPLVSYAYYRMLPNGSIDCYSAKGVEFSASFDTCPIKEALAGCYCGRLIERAKCAGTGRRAPIGFLRHL